MLNKFMEKIKFSDNYLFEMVSEIKASNLPLIMYGAGAYGERIFSLLKENDVLIDSVGITDSYFTPNKIFCGRSVYPISSLLNYYEKVNLIIAFTEEDAGLRERLLKMGDGDTINKIFFYDCSFQHEYFTKSDFIDYAFIKENQHTFYELFEKLEDDLSKNTLIAYLNQRISGNGTYLREYHCDNQYFINEIPFKNQDEVFIDCGAFDGDTIHSFIKNISAASCNYSLIYGFECDSESFMKLIKLKETVPNLICINKGVWHETTTLRFSDAKQTCSYISDEGNIAIEVDSIDNILDGEKASFIKMDVEGSELNALKGAQKTILAYTPKLAICAYHRKEDLLTIPQYILSLVPEYRLYLRAHKYIADELVLYAICD